MSPNPNNASVSEGDFSNIYDQSSVMHDSSSWADMSNSKANNHGHNFMHQNPVYMQNEQVFGGYGKSVDEPV